MPRLPRSSAYARARTPNFQRLKLDASSGEIDDCLHVAFSQDYADNDRLLRVLGEQRDELASKVKWLEDLVNEGERFLPLHEEGVVGLDRLKETLERERKVLAHLVKTMDAAQKGREEKKLICFCLVDRLVGVSGICV